jgi:hypothetical protein
LHTGKLDQLGQKPCSTGGAPVATAALAASVARGQKKAEGDQKNNLKAKSLQYFLSPPVGGVKGFLLYIATSLVKTPLFLVYKGRWPVLSIWAI